MTDTPIVIKLRAFVVVLLPVLLLLFSAQSRAQSPIQQSNAGLSQSCVNTADISEAVNLLPYLSFYEDDTTTLEAPWRNLPAETFRPVQGSGLTAVFADPGSAYWVRFCLHNSTDVPRSLVLTFEPPLIQQFDFYPMAPGAQSFQTGNSRPFSTRDLNHPSYHFSAELDAGEQQEFFLRLYTNGNLFLIGAVYDERHYHVIKDRDQGAYGIFAGIFLGLILYNLMLYLTIRQASALWYVVFATTIFSLLTFFDGWFHQYLLPDAPALSYQLTLLNYWLASLVAGLFYRSYLKLGRYPLLDRLGFVLLGVFTLVLLVAYLMGTATYVRAATVFVVAVIIYYALIVNTYLVTRGVSEARYFLYAQSLFVLVVLDRSLLNLGLTDRYYVFYSPSAGLAGTMIMLAYAVGKTLNDDKDKAQQQALEQLRISNELRENYSRKLEKDISEATAEIRQKNDVLAKKAQELEDLNSAKSHFFANISHEFRTPLTLIQGPLGSLLERADDDDSALVKSVIRQSQQLQNLIDQLLALSKFDSDALQLEASKMDVVSFVRHLSSQFSSFAEQKGIALNFTCAHETLSVYLDREKFQIVINNLLSNAVKFTDQGGRIDVDVSVVGIDATDEADFDPDNLSTDAYVQISVTDTGQGIPETSLPYVFDRYFQAKQTTGLQQGTGIGLALARELVNMHVGQIRASSIEGVGSRFVVQIPLGKAHLKPGELRDVETPATDIPELAPDLPASAAPLNEEPAMAGVPQSNSGVGRLLVVDDNADMREYLCALLQPFYQVVTAKDGVHAEEVLRQQDVALVITDMMMPRRDGLGLIELLRADTQFAHIPVIMLTARAGQEDKLTGLQSLADDYLIKPFDAKELLARIHVLLRKQAQMRAFYGVATKPAVAEGSDAAPDTGPSGLEPSDHQISGHERPDHEHSDHEPLGHDLLSRMRRIVEARLHEQGFGVENLARDMYMSTPTLRRRLAETASFTPSDFIRQCRLEKARQLAATGQYRNLGALAAAVGFNQASYFARLYRQAFNVSPLAGDEPSQDAEQGS
ncbi:MAG: 7TM diverse intracellular signaling domain-containing protein [Pseudohongiella sp.]|uniref:7TM diverse intracellular signaling domain-containing protein n=1 Tax=Pseudohongiella sp. TaxID=1979412 RepID=UPI0034A0893F